MRGDYVEAENVVEIRERTWERTEAMLDFSVVMLTVLREQAAVLVANSNLQTYSISSSDAADDVPKPS